MNPLSLLAQYDSATMPEIILWPAILSIAGLIIWGLFWRLEKGGGNGKPRWAAFIPLAIAAFLAWNYFSLSIDPGVDGSIYRDSIGHSRRLIYGAYFAFLFPIGAIIGLTAWHYIDRHLSKFR